jgi:hypothetical protein
MDRIDHSLEDLQSPPCPRRFRASRPFARSPDKTWCCCPTREAAKLKTALLDREMASRRAPHDWLRPNVRPPEALRHI